MLDITAGNKLFQGVCNEAIDTLQELKQKVEAKARESNFSVRIGYSNKSKKDLTTITSVKFVCSCEGIVRINLEIIVNRFCCG